uniref:Movement protein P4 n=1 Tax=Barley yellow dwarf virus (isolate MAV) TaxID=2169984 RepID=B6RCJ5_BYDVM|nr:movement protein P4 [Barley yellow dwarf virus MAV]
MSQNALELFGQWLWSNHPEAESDEDPIDEQIEEGQILYLDQQAGLRYSLSQSTTLRPTPPGQSNSAPIFRNVLRFQTEYLSPTTVTRSQTLRSSLSPTPHQPQPALSLLNSTLRAHNQPLVARLTHTPSQNLEPRGSPSTKLVARTSGKAR